jgi:hypothetical protein
MSEGKIGNAGVVREIGGKTDRAPSDVEMIHQKWDGKWDAFDSIIDSMEWNRFENWHIFPESQGLDYNPKYIRIEGHLEAQVFQNSFMVWGNHPKRGRVVIVNGTTIETLIGISACNAVFDNWAEITKEK